MEKQEKIAAIIREHVTFDPTKGLQGVEEAAKRISQIGMWECIDDETNDGPPEFTGENNWRKSRGIKKGDVVSGIMESEGALLIGGYCHDISKFKQL